MTLPNRILLAAGAALLIAGAPAAAQDAVSMVYDPKAVETPPQKVAGACALAVIGIADNRNNKETVGSEFRPLLSKDPTPWVGAALGQLGDYGYTVARAGGAKPGVVAINAALTRAYTFHGPLRLNGVVAMDARITTAAGRQMDRKYRASGSKTNMWGAVDEYMETLNYAMNNLLAQLAADLQKACADR